MVWRGLGYLGLLPFIGCLWLFEYLPQLAEVDFLQPYLNTFVVKPQQAFIFYSTIILSFMAGSLWKKDTYNANTHTSKINSPSSSKALSVISNLICLFAFACLFLSIFYSLILLPLGYLCALLIEYYFCNKKDPSFTPQYIKMRIILTAIVISLHAIALILWF